MGAPTHGLQEEGGRAVPDRGPGRGGELDSKGARLQAALERLASPETARLRRRGCLAVNTATEMGEEDETASAIVREIFGRMERALQATIEEGQRSGELDRDRDPKELASLLLTTLGIEGFKGFIDSIRERFPHLRANIKQVFAEGDFVIAHVHGVRQLADKHPEKRLAPPVGTNERAEHYQWILFAMIEVEGPLATIVQHTRSLPEGPRVHRRQHLHRSRPGAGRCAHDVQPHRATRR